MIPKFNGNPLEKNAQKFVEHRRQYKIHKYRPNDLNFLDNASLPNSLPSSIIPPAFSLPFSLRLAPSLCLHDVSVFLSVYLSVAVSLSIFLCLSGCLSFFFLSLITFSPIVLLSPVSNYLFLFFFRFPHP